MKYIVLSFDDAREDFYTQALPVMKKYGIRATVNVISDFVGRQDLKGVTTGRCATWAQLEECRQYGIEIANHSSDHKNSVKGVLACKEALDEHFGPDIRGFISPGSYLTKENVAPYLELKEKQQISYIRSGNQIRRDGYFYALIYLAARWSRSSLLFRLLNRRFVFSLGRGNIAIYPSVMLDCYNTAEQACNFVRSMKDGQAAIFMFHSILDEADPARGKDKWYNSTTFFESLCSFLASQPDTCVLTNAELHQMVQRAERNQ